MPAIIPIPAFDDNYIWLLQKGRHAAVVDPGDADPVLQRLDRDGLELTAILVTHHHGDHTGGIAGLLARWAVPVFGPAREKIGGRTHALVDGDVAALPQIDFLPSVRDVPGHTAGHIAYVGAFDGSPVAFVGDTLFGGGCGRLFEGTPAQMANSLARLAELPGNTRVYCAHEYTLANLRFARVVEPANQALADRQGHEQQRRDRGQPTVPMTLDVERATNPFLRTRVPAVIAAAATWAGRPLPDEVAVFAALREWKNGFR